MAQVKNATNRSDQENGKERQRKMSYRQDAMKRSGVSLEEERFEVVEEEESKQKGEEKNKNTEKADEAKERSWMREIKEKNDTMMKQQEENIQRMEEVKDHIEESREKYNELAKIVRGQTEIVEKLMRGKKIKNKEISAAGMETGQKEEEDQVMKENTGVDKESNEMKEIRERNKLLMEQQEESMKRINKVTREVEESKAKYGELTKTVTQQSEMMKIWMEGQKVKDDLVLEMREEQEENKK